MVPLTASALTLFRSYLSQLKARGSTHISVDRPGRDALNQLAGYTPRSAAPPPVSSATPSLHSSSVAPATQVSLRSLLMDEPPPSPPLPLSARAVSAPSSAPAAASAQGLIQLPSGTAAEQIAALVQIAQQDPQPRHLGSLREKMVFSTGTPTAALMLIGEAPGAEEEKQGEPFVGPAGQLLTKILSAMGLTRDQVYISNICKYRPAMEGFQGMKNRTPTAQEMQVCLPYIQTEISVVQPRCIVALGATAATGLGIEGKVGALRSRFHALGTTPVMVTYHPSYLLRQDQEGPEASRQAKLLVWQDLLMVMEKLAMPISPKQRAYFQPKA
jgi:uracil-DNA glycosylase